jgi:hypothetical protein
MGLKDRLCFQFHDSNPSGVTADALIQLFTEINLEKAAAACTAAQDQKRLGNK